MRKNFQKNFQKHCREQKRVLYLHPLSRRVCWERQKQKTSSLTYWIDSVAGWRKRRPAQKRTDHTRVPEHWISFGRWKVLGAHAPWKNNDEEFDPGSGWTLAAGLTHASRTAAALRWPASGGWVSNAYATYLSQWDSPEKFGLIPHSMQGRHRFCIKHLWVRDGHAFY